MGAHRKPQKSLMELMEGQQGKAAPAQTIPSLVSSLPARSHPTVPRHPPQSPPQPVPINAAEQEKHKERKSKEAADASRSRPTQEEGAQRAVKQQKTRHPATRGQEKPDSPHPDSPAWLPAPMLEQAEQKGYELGIAETEKALRAEVPEVCRIFCARTWNEALNRAGVEASSELRKPDNVYYPEAIRSSAPQSYQADTPSPAINPPNEEVPSRNSPNKPITASKSETTSHDFQQELDSTVQSTGGITN
ncbi:uncharacterized protein LOC115979724 [Quercus lobata]|uniref:uncharacterized protein LOC115979724 n=1 Tax=Quercus lobata TaxID=97700 RepID=UPI0012482B95|nr:uncharacterized protein LOC115979724 [Quercus lobata]